VLRRGRTDALDLNPGGATHADDHAGDH
jgi:hypothetical protein